MTIHGRGVAFAALCLGGTLLLGADLTSSPVDEWEAHYYAGFRARSAGELDRAEEHWRAALSEAEREASTPIDKREARSRVLRALDALGHLAAERKEWAEAERIFLQISSVSVSDEDTIDHWALPLIAVYEEQGKWKEAEDLLKRSLGSAESSSRPLTAARRLIMLGEHFSQRGDDWAAEKYYREGFARLEESGLSETGLARALSGGLADVLMRLQRYDEAADLYRSLIARHEKCGGFGLAHFLDRYADSLEKLGDEEGAARARARAEEARERQGAVPCVPEGLTLIPRTSEPDADRERKLSPDDIDPPR
jgi:tetratricopeptide (TPR) repeat protein